MQHLKEHALTESLLISLRYSGARLCHNYLLVLMSFWAVTMFAVPVVAMAFEVIEAGHQGYGSNSYSIGMLEWLQTTMDRVQGLLLLALAAFGLTAWAINENWASKFLWMIPTTLVHLYLLGAIV